jgi:superfamily II DNA or RNA helicase
VTVRPYTDERLGRLLIIQSKDGDAPLPHCKPLGDTDRWVTRHNNANVKALRKRGYDAPDVSAGYHWPGRFDYYDHQKDTARHLAENRRSWCTNGLRSGKTSSASLAADLIKSCDELDRDSRILVLCPINIMTTAWFREMRYIDRKNTYFVTNKGTKEARKAMESGECNTLIMNDDKLAWLTEEIDAWNPDLIIVDEAHRFKNPETDRYQCLSYLTKPTAKTKVPGLRRLWLLTGTPVPNGPGDMYHLQLLVDPGAFPPDVKKFKDWMALTCVRLEKRVSKTKVVWDYKPRAGHEQIVADAMQPCIRYRTQDCVELPPQAYNEYECALSKDQTKMIKQLIQHYRAVDEQNPDKSVVAVNAAARVGKIMQISCGAVYSEDGGVSDVGAPQKLAQTLELIAQNTGKTLIFCIYKGAQKWIQAQLRKKKITSEIVNGEVTPTAKTAIVDKFQLRRSPQVLILHPKVEGMTLTQADISIWWGPPESNMQWTQANARMQGGSDHKTLVAMLYSSSMEKQRYYARMENEERQSRTIDLYAAALQEFGSAADLDAFEAINE